MTDVQNTPNAPTAAVDMDQALSSLKKHADRMGITYKSNVSVATLQKAIADKQAELEGITPESISATKITTAKAGPTEAEIHAAAYDKAMKLVRVIITPMEANKASGMDSEIFCAGNSVVGTVKRVVRFGEPWHVEQILLNTIKEKKFQMFSSKKGPQGDVQTTARQAPAYNVAILDPLTEEEIDALADHQIRTRSLEDE